MQFFDLRFLPRVRIGIALACLTAVVVSSSGAGVTAGAIPRTSPVGQVSSRESAVATTGQSWTEVMIEYERAKARRDHGRVIELMSGLLRQNLSKEQVAIALTNRGVAHAYKHEEDKAMEDFDQALRIDPHYPLAYGARATLWAQNLPD